MNAFSLAGPLGRFLDADHDVLLEGRFVTFELETLVAMGPKVVVPVATYTLPIASINGSTADRR